jgi:tight adherence protein B
MFNTAAMILSSCTLLLVGAALWLLSVARARATREQAKVFIDEQARLVQARYQETVIPERQQVPDLMRYWNDLLARADIVPNRRFYLMTGVPLLLVVLTALALGGLFAAVIVLALGVLLGVFWLWKRAVTSGERLRLQLPSFLDGVLRMMTIGSSIPSAFQSAAGATEPPLRTCLAKAIQLQRAGTDLDQAMFYVARQYRIQELLLLAAVLRMSQRYGGRADIVMERTAAFMRDREQAQRELLALSSETRMSAWVLGLLPVVICGVIILSNPNYVFSMWADSTGRVLIYSAVALQMLGAVLLYRLAKAV